MRKNARAHAGGPDRIVAAGGSAGANLAAIAALSDSDVTAVIGLYSYYGRMGSGPGPMSPQQVANLKAPPLLLVHGSPDTLVPRQQARAIDDRLRAVSHRPVAYAELPGAQHSFDVFPSIRLQAVTDAIVRFAELTRPTCEMRQPTRRSQSPESRETAHRDNAPEASR